MKIKSYIKDGMVVLEPEGELLPRQNVDRLDEKLYALLGKGQKRVLVDLGRINRLDPSAISVLFRHHSRFKAIGGILKLANLSKIWSRS